MERENANERMREWYAKSIHYYTRRNHSRRARDSWRERKTREGEGERVGERE